VKRGIRKEDLPTTVNPYIYRYDLINNIWTKIVTNGQDVGNIPMARFGHAAVAYNGKMLLFFLYFLFYLIVVIFIC
jgi:hypothetical protein